MSHVNTSNSTRKEQYLYYNTLACLLKNLERKYTTVDLRNECSVTGKISKVDAHMNVEMEDAVFRKPHGDEIPLKTFFITSRQIRYVHIPRGKNILELIEEQLACMTKTPKHKKAMPRTLKVSRAKRYNAETVRTAYSSAEPSTSKDTN